jgi:hypothetical protein
MNAPTGDAAVPRTQPWDDTTIAANGRQVRENFAAWFGQSKVVDSTGAPYVAYHGTLANFDAFELGHGQGASEGFMFVGHENVDNYLHSYLDSVKFQDDRSDDRGDHFFMPVYLSLQNPKAIDTTGTGEWADPDSENAEISRAKRQGHDGLIITDRDQGTRFFVVFEASQIKSAIGNSGLYGPGCSLCDSVAEYHAAQQALADIERPRMRT